MIIRVFRPTVRPGREAEFERFLRTTSIPALEGQHGMVSAHVGRPRDRSSNEYVVVSVWDDIDSIRAFAGDDWPLAVSTPDEELMLSESTIGHYETLSID